MEKPDIWWGFILLVGQIY